MVVYRFKFIFNQATRMKFSLKYNIKTCFFRNMHTPLFESYQIYLKANVDRTGVEHRFVAY